MTEADLLYHNILVREQLDQTVAQLVALTFALFVGVYYFLHRSGIWMKVGVFILYMIGWLVFISSGNLTALHWHGIFLDIQDIVESGKASHSTLELSSFSRSSGFQVYIIAVNISSYLLLIGSFVFLFFWKHPDHSEEPIELDNHDPQEKNVDG